MVTYLKLPKLTWTMEEGSIGEWLKREGERVQKGEPICIIETEKTTDEIYAPDSGILRKIVFPAGNTVPVNQIIALIAEPDEQLPDLERIIDEARKVVAGPLKPEAVVTESVEKPKAKIIGEERIKISPLARKLAEEHGIDITKIRGSGPSGRIVREDIEKAIEMARAVPLTVPPSSEGAKVIPLTGMRKVIANRLSWSARTAVHVPITIEVNMSDAVKLCEAVRGEYEKRAKIRLSYTDMLVKAVAKALEENPMLNSMLENGQIKILDDINIGVAVALEGGLIVPVIRNANRKSLLDIAIFAEELVEKARQKKLLTREVSGGTFTITNLGMYGIDMFAPTINPPETAILGVGRIVKKLVVIDDKIMTRSMMTVTLVFDHRVIDGAQAAKFLQRLREILENPQLMLV